jgi:hypothetical protein
MSSKDKKRVSRQNLRQETLFTFYLLPFIPHPSSLPLIDRQPLIHILRPGVDSALQILDLLEPRADQ